MKNRRLLRRDIDYNEYKRKHGKIRVPLKGFEYNFNNAAADINHMINID